ncbi:VPLPA-CTERM sorting domain-containing protein [Methylomonas koyamae]|uniref:VPLPA-CTERM sorting domain-containing protein n=1 Tax=Methylomonas koyamae TaxID=702114 RepID=UPI00112D0F69|nr:VPLPA-CTERM sorting domain-containing protein [Methylomonas koyamae]TPQ25991.1 hypothetical protein C2U68_12620 [Methylomonas koyamae]
MKNLNKALLATALLASSAGANAAIWASSTTGANEAFLSVYDKTQKTTFTLDLGVTYNDFFNNKDNAAYSLSFDLNALTAGSPNAKWSAFAANMDAANTSWGVMTTNAGKMFVTGEKSIAKFANLTAANNVAIAIRSHVSQVNTGAVADNAGVANANQASTNLSSIVVDSDTAGTGQHNQNLPFATIFGTVSAADADINGAEGAFWFYNQQNGNSQTLQSWHMDLAAGKLTYGNAAPVPLPAAVWMFGAGLMGVLRSTRRKYAA